jgi:hypothetical protein
VALTLAELFPFAILRYPATSAFFTRHAALAHANGATFSGWGTASLPD